MSYAQAGAVKKKILDVAQLLISKKGFTAVGLNEVLQAAQVPKGSFYHYFGSKDAFGVALLDGYFEAYLNEITAIFADQKLTEMEKLDLYFCRWIENQTGKADSGKCLAVKLGAEVADLSEPMRLALHRGTSKIIDCLASAISRHQLREGLWTRDCAQPTALQLYSLWMGASVMAKIMSNAEPFSHAMSITRKVLFSTP
ncbi:TetR/AcrR family transcriptional regulator [Pseudomonas juntendi]|uniref:TetR/AcrR family transcriptional regulator n=1 Tax=Pseudomonas juntendi TaxID=2666183 RepID=UPI0018D9F18A|nr:TetR/AcrR family transcriptional regulator [Pseudomonas juntendi]MBH3382803.1 TetR/AcrR family transcriptional regulator [Pseudomonas juntendi]